MLMRALFACSASHSSAPRLQALIHGLNRHYYSMLINYRKQELEERMLLNLSKKGWAAGLTLEPFEAHAKSSADMLEALRGFAERYAREVADEAGLSPEERVVAKVGQLDAKKNIARTAHHLLASTIGQSMGTMLDSVVF